MYNINQNQNPSLGLSPFKMDGGKGKTALWSDESEFKRQHL